LIISYRVDGEGSLVSIVVGGGDGDDTGSAAALLAHVLGAMEVQAIAQVVIQRHV
jgi:hypothetical protein